METKAKLIIVMNNDKTFFVDCSNRDAINFMDLLHDVNATYSWDESGYDVVIPIRSVAYARIKLVKDIEILTSDSVSMDMLK